MPLGAYVKVPTSVVENLWLLTPAETALTLVVLRRGSRAGTFVPVSVSDDNWQKWTGLSPRQREYAIAGLREKGLHMEGRGDKAKFSFDIAEFSRYARSAVPQSADVRTKGRAKGVSVPAGTLVHPDCKNNGCQMLCGGPEQSCKPQPAVSLPDASPVAPAAAGGPKRADLVGLVSEPRGRSLLDQFPLTMAQFKTLGFTLVGLQFLRALVDKCGGAGVVADRVLAESVGLAWAAKKRRQKSEGLFLLTVPPMVAAVNEAATSRAAAPVGVACVECFDLKLVLDDALNELPCPVCVPGPGLSSSA